MLVKNNRSGSLMKKYINILLCFGFVIALTPNSYANELKIYRKKVTKFEKGVATAIAAAGAIGLGITSWWVYYCKKNDKSFSSPDFFMPTLGGVSFSALLFMSSGLMFNYMNKQDKKIDKPMLIFDQDGFTYETDDDKDVRYLWKDVVNRWQITTVDKYNFITGITWCYQIKDVKDIVKINALALDIPDELKAKVESLRLGFVQALND